MNFSGFIFDLKMLKIIKKMIKSFFNFARDPRGCDVARKATWQRQADPAQRLRGAFYIYIYSLFNYSKYKRFFSFP